MTMPLAEQQTCEALYLAGYSLTEVAERLPWSRSVIWRVLAQRDVPRRAPGRPRGYKVRDSTTQLAAVAQWSSRTLSRVGEEQPSSKRQIAGSSPAGGA